MRELEERVVVFGGESPLVGVLARPQGSSCRPSAPVVILLNAGLLHRVGPQALYTSLARRLAESGVLSLRFDASGIGDSPASTSPSAREERSRDELRKAISLVEKLTGRRPVVLAGLCSGADLAFDGLFADERVRGSVLINGGLFDAELLRNRAEESEARARRRYYKKRLLDPRSWKSAFLSADPVGKMHRSVASLLRDYGAPSATPRAAPRDALAVEARLRELQQHGKELLVVCSEGSSRWDLLQIVLQERSDLEQFDNIHFEFLRDCDHVFTLRWTQELLMQVVTKWIQRMEFGLEAAPPDRQARLRSPESC